MSESTSVIIVGAPRSGTSLLQHIIRSSPGFVSPAKESQHIWSPYVHPSLNDWRFEGVSAERLDAIDPVAVRDELYSQAIDSQLWQVLRRSGVYDSPRLMAMARAAGKPLLNLLGSLNQLLPFRSNGTGERFVDKSVQGGLWLDLILDVLPDCRIIHISRDPFLTVPSMMEAWREPERFGSYKVPLRDGHAHWCFGLVPDWRKLLDQPLDIRCAHQWLAVNEGIECHANTLKQSGRYLQVQLEELVGAPDMMIPKLVDYMGIGMSPYWRSLTGGLPVINSGKHAKQKADELSQEARAVVGAMRARLGYD